MKITHVNFEEKNFGITIKSLTELRNLLADKLHHRIVIFQIKTSELTCGFLVFDWEYQNASFTGDGFRTDGGGEGGAGFKSAGILFNLFGINVNYSATFLEDEFYKPDGSLNERRFWNFAEKLAEELSDLEFKKPIDELISYVR